MQTSAPSKNMAAQSSQLSPLEIMVRARYPLIYVVTWEEERAMLELAGIAERLGKAMYDWTISNGLSRFRKDVHNRSEGRRDTRDPILMLKEITASNEAAIFVLRDFHEFMNNSEVKRRLRDLAGSLRHTLATAIILGPTLKLPEELEKDIAVYDFPLPNRDDLETLLQQLAQDVAGNRQLRVDTSPGSMDAIIDAAIGLTQNEAENVFAKTLVEAGSLSAAEAPLVYAEKRQVIRKSGLLEYIDNVQSMSDVGGLDNLKRWVQLRKSAIQPEAHRVGLPSPRGLLLVGVQGCGKSLAAKAISGELSVPLIRLDIGRMYSKMMGDTESNIRRALALAEALAPIVLWIDEFEKAMSGSGSSDQSDGGSTARVFGTILTWMQEKDKPVFVVATANDIDKLPPEVLRKGRFDEIFFVDLPSPSERETIFRVHLRNWKMDPENFNLPRLAELSNGYSGAEIEQAIIEGLYRIYQHKPALDQGDLEATLKDMVPLSKTMRKAIQDRRTWAVGRTVSASLGSNIQETLDLEAEEAEREKIGMYERLRAIKKQYGQALHRDTSMFLGEFPPLSQDVERMRVYLQSYERIIKQLSEDGSSEELPAT